MCRCQVALLGELAPTVGASFRVFLHTHAVLRASSGISSLGVSDGIHRIRLPEEKSGTWGVPGGCRCSTEGRLGQLRRLVCAFSHS